MTALLLGHTEQAQIFAQAVLSGRTPPVWLLAGPPGIGKAAFAHQAALFLLTGGDERPFDAQQALYSPLTHQAHALIEAGAHPEYLRLERLPQESRGKDGTGKLARNITVDQVRAMLNRLRTRPALSRWRTVIIDSIDDCERGAANALLKSLEEPPACTLFFLVSSAPARLLPTIRSRCRVLRFHPLDSVQMGQALSGAMPALPAEEIAALTRLAGGSPGRAMRMASAGVVEAAGQLRRIAQEGDRDGSLRSALAQTMAPMAARARFEALLEQATHLAAELALAAPAGQRAQALAIYDHVRDVAGGAIPLSEDAATVTFTLATALAGHADLRQPA